MEFRSCCVQYIL